MSCILTQDHVAVAAEDALVFGLVNLHCRHLDAISSEQVGSHEHCFVYHRIVLHLLCSLLLFADRELIAGERVCNLFVAEVGRWWVAEVERSRVSRVLKEI